jgi:alpha-beta hydrolase superfamily lysophospholipase
MRVVRRILGLLAAALFGAIATLLAVYIVMASNLPDLQPWHQPLLEEDFGEDSQGEGFAGYLEREERVFGSLAAAIAGRDRRGRAARFDRYSRVSPSNAANHPRNWNRTYVFDTPEPRGGVLLLHGLSDSPYSLRSIGELFRDRGFFTVGLRVPGHGTIPGELLRTTWRDCRQAVRAAARHVGEHLGADQPFFVVGYSNGAALATDYALDAIASGDGPRPAAVILFSPALAVSPVARLARWQRRISAVPGLGKLAWTSVLPEFDPYKYNSFPVFAGEQIYSLTSQLEARLAEWSAQGRLADFPPVLAFQSLVDATIPASSVVDRLLKRLPPNGSEFVLFDVNRLAESEDFLRGDHESTLHSLMEAPELPFTLTLVTNAHAETRALVARVRRAGTPPGSPPEIPHWTEAPLGLSWPRGVFSLSHVALPFSADDPIYGLGGDDGDPQALRLGALEPRGERGVLGISMDQLMRLRYNPFFPYVEKRILEWIEATVAK